MCFYRIFNSVVKTEIGNHHYCRVRCVTCCWGTVRAAKDNALKGTCAGIGLSLKISAFGGCESEVARWRLWF